MRKWERGIRKRERETKRKLSRCKSSQFLAHYAILKCVFNKMTQKNFEDGLIQNTSKRVPT
jgi:hypothetical protein